jgi:histidinol-phosphate phosphatase family protein
MSAVPHGIRQAVVVCGGQGTRLACVLGELPKALAPVAGRPLLAWLLVDLARAGVAEVLLLAGVGADAVARAAQELAPAGLRVRAVVEDAPLGTAGALQNAAAHLEPRFLYVLGDVFTALDWSGLAAAGEATGGLATLVVHRSSHPEDSDVVALGDDDRLIAWVSRRPDERRRASIAGVALGNAGAAVLDRRILQRIPRDRPSDLFGEILPPLVALRAPVFGYRTSEYVRDLGTPTRLAAVAADVAAGRTRRRAEAVLLDRDGVLTEDRGPVWRPADLRLLPGAAAALARLAAAGVRTALVTNQPAAARGLCRPETLDRVNERLQALLADHGARLDRIFECRHHPETHHREGVAALRGPCRCRKPSTGLVDDALASLERPAWRTVVIGDRTDDLQLAHNAGLPGIALATGAGCADGRCPARPSQRFTDLTTAVDWLLGDTDA